MRALVTGGVGFIGTNLCERLLKDGYSVVSFDNYTTGDIKNEFGGVKYLKVDIRDGIKDGAFFDKIQHAWVHTKEFDVIFHLAALPRIGPSFNNPKEVCDVNVGGTQNVLEYAKKHKIPVVYAGSSSFWGGTHKNPYTFSKWQGEELVKMYNKIYDIPTAICRFYNVYGPNQLTEGEYCTVIGIFERQYKEGVDLTITGDGEQRRDFTHVSDIVDGFVKCGDNIDKASGEVFELGRGENYSINVVAQSFDCGFTYIPKRPGEVQETLCTDTKAKELLGWEPKIDLLDYIEEKRND